jgi:hypothetical protein
MRGRTAQVSAPSILSNFSMARRVPRIMSSFCSTSFFVADDFGLVLRVFSIGSTMGGIDASTVKA